MIVSPESPLGNYISIYLARATDPSIRARRAGGGGAVTAILIYMIEKGVVDAAVIARRTRGYTGEIVVARTRKEIIEASGTRWDILPFTARLRERLSSVDIRRAALVGLPCQAQFLQQTRMFPVLETDFSTKIHVIISLFCIGTFATEAFVSHLSTRLSLDLKRTSL